MYGFRRGSGGAGGSGNVSTLSGGANGRITLWNGATTVTGDPSGTWSGTGHQFVLGSPTFNASDGHFTGPAGASFGPSSVGGGFTNQPAGDTVTLVSDNAADNTQQVTIIGTLAGVDASENIMLTDVTPVVSVGTYDLVLALVLNGACAGTVTASETSGGLTITTIAPAALSAGLQTFGAIDGYGKVLQIVASGATTKTVGIGGYALGGGIQREPVVLTGTTKVNTTNTWEGAVQFYLGDLEATRTVTLNSIAGFDFMSVAGVFEPVEAGSLAASNLTAGRVLLATVATGSTGATTVGDDAGCTWTGTGASFVAAFGGGIALPATTGAVAGVVTSGGSRFIHRYQDPTATGYNLFVGAGAGNFTMGPGGGAADLGSFNVGIGPQSLALNTTGSYNTGLGALTLATNTTGKWNLAFGSGALNANTTGISNVAIGADAMYLHTTGGQNTALGHFTLYSSVSASQNTAIGYAALTNTTASVNTAVGYSSLSTNTTGTLNTAVGAGALEANVDGQQNTALGGGALQTNVSGVGNTSVGYMAGYTGKHYFNTFVGDQAGYSNDDNSSVFLGYGAGYYETGGGKLFIDNAKRASEADGRAKALIYGVFDAAVANQRLTINALMNVNLATLQVFANNAAAVTGGLVAGDLYRTGADPDPIMVVH